MEWVSLYCSCLFGRVFIGLGWLQQVWIIQCLKPKSFGDLRNSDWALGYRFEPLYGSMIHDDIIMILYFYFGLIAHSWFFKNIFFNTILQKKKKKHSLKTILGNSLFVELVFSTDEFQLKLFCWRDKFQDFIRFFHEFHKKALKLVRWRDKFRDFTRFFYEFHKNAIFLNSFKIVFFFFVK